MGGGEGVGGLVREDEAELESETSSVPLMPPVHSTQLTRVQSQGRRGFGLPPQDHGGASDGRRGPLLRARTSPELLASGSLGRQCARRRRDADAISSSAHISVPEVASLDGREPRFVPRNHTHALVHVCVYAYMYIYIHTYTHKHTPAR